MNFLAHLLLSGNSDGVVMGNFVGDFIKGRLSDEKTTNWNPDYVVGLKLHRFIDSFTDAHAVVREAKKMAARDYGKLSGIIVDIYFDYFLAKYFADFCTESLWEYSHRMYSVIERNDYLVPETMIPMARAMIRQDWLNSYDTFEGIALTFHRMSRRTGFMEPIYTAADELRNNEMFYDEKFKTFFPELRHASTGFILEHAVSGSGEGKDIFKN
jgi:acyl carrier protein phosphodiesterase